MLSNTIFDNIPPFDFLSAAERGRLLLHAKTISLKDAEIVCCEDDLEYDHMYLILEGGIAVYNEKGAAHPIQHHSSPTYFGEMSLFFNQPRSATVRASGNTKCVQLTGDDIRAAVQTNHSFGSAFAFNLLNKQRIFHGYEVFMNLLFSKVAQGYLSLDELIPGYLGLNSILHEHARQPEIDFGALGYALSRLPNDITRLSTLLLTEDFADMYRGIQNEIRLPSKRSSKRKFFEIMPGKCTVQLRDRKTDIIDLVTKLCIYSVETRKIRKRLESTELGARLADWWRHGGDANTARELTSAMPFNADELQKIQELFGETWLKKLYETITQHNNLTLYFQSAVNRYMATAWENWGIQLRAAIEDFLGAEANNPELEIHIISSNNHSVHNCLSPWLHQNTEEIMRWGRENVPNLLAGLDKPADQLYTAYRHWRMAHPERLADIAAAERASGIYPVLDSSSAGINLNLIDLARLSAERDPDLAQVQPQRGLIVNIDYAYGLQARSITQMILLILGKRIRSFSVFGKAGALTGKRGDILLPHHLIDQQTDEVYPLPQNGLSAPELEALGFPHEIHSGVLLTVPGTSMQNSLMLRYYRVFRGAIGMEMEGSFYLREIIRGQMEGILPADMAVNFIYYTSDTPLNPNESLTAKMTIPEGVPAVYSITRAILGRVLTATRDS